MSYDVGLCQDGKAVNVDRFAEGGTQVLDGSTEAVLNITYNYAPFFYQFLDEKEGLRSLYGKTGREAIAPLESAIEKLGVDRHPNYWEATPGNAGYALSVLLGWAQQHPDAIFDGN